MCGFGSGFKFDHIAVKILEDLNQFGAKNRRKQAQKISLK